MRYEHCRVSHNPEAGSYGDCIRACIASLLDLDAEKVPHFAYDNASAETVRERMDDYLAGYGLKTWWTHYPPDIDRAELLEMLSGGIPYMLMGASPDGIDHVVICCNGKVVHDPAWYPSTPVKGGSHGAWSVVVLARV